MSSGNTGRNFFDRHRTAIFLVVRVFSVMPRFFRNFLWGLFDSYEGLLSVGVRYCLLASSSKKCGRNVFVGSRVVLRNIQNLSLGDNVSIHSGCYLDALGGIEIGDNVSIAHQSSILSFEHTWKDSDIPIKYNELSCLGVHICSDVWIGCGVRVLDGARIDCRVVVAAGAVVKGDLGAKGIYGGVPAKRIKSI